MKPERDLWQYLARSQKTVVMYGMGNGADKILRVCEGKGIEIAEFFASDGFVRGHSFHGKRVLSFSEVSARYGRENLIVLVSFASHLPNVIAQIAEVARQCETYIPDVPVFGEGLFDLGYVTAHEKELIAARELLADEKSRALFDSVVSYRLTGKIDTLMSHTCTREEVYSILGSERIERSADLGAYNGDTVRELASFAPRLRHVTAVEPDGRNYRKLEAFSREELPYELIPVPAAAWKEETILHFDGSGNRNANVSTGGKCAEVAARPLDAILCGERVDYIKYDVEGSEREALIGSSRTIKTYRPALLVSLYHRVEDLYALPLQIAREYPDYRFYLCRYPCFPAWDLQLLCVKE